jgi:hypothetical protein
VKYGARIARCGCMMRLVGEHLVSVTPCGDDLCERMVNTGPERVVRRAGLPFILTIPEEVPK